MFCVAQELCLYLDEERGGAPPLASSTTALCTDCGGPLSGASSSASGPPLPSRDEGDGSSSSTNNDESELSASTLADELKAVQARQQMYAYRDDDRLAMAKSGLNGECSGTPGEKITYRKPGRISACAITYPIRLHPDIRMHNHIS